MPRCDFSCNNCKTVLFSRILSLVEYEEARSSARTAVVEEVEQCWSAFHRIMSKESA